MRDEEIFQAAGRAQDWAPLAGTGADARARSVALRRTRYAGVAGATAAVAVGAVAVAGALGPGNGAGRGGASIVAGSHGTPTAVPTTPEPTTMGAYFEKWKSCPDSDLATAGIPPTAPKDLRQRWLDACHRDIATLSELLPGFDVTPDLQEMEEQRGDRPPADPDEYSNPSSVVPSGWHPHWGPNRYRIVGKDGKTSQVLVQAFGKVFDDKGLTGEPVTLANGLKGWLTSGTVLDEAHTRGYEIFVQDQGRTFSLEIPGTIEFDFRALVLSPQFGQLVTEALAAPES